MASAPPDRFCSTGTASGLTGPESLTDAEQVRLIGEALGRPLRYEELSPEELRKAISPYPPADLRFGTWERHIGSSAPVIDAIGRLTGGRRGPSPEWAANYGR